MRSRVLVIWMVVGLLISAAVVHAQDRPASTSSNKGSILLVTAYWAPNVPYRLRYYEQHLREMGYQTALMPFNQLTDENLAKFNMVMFLEFAMVNDTIVSDDWGQCTSKYHDALAGRLEKYVNQGGGLFFFSVGPVNGRPGSKAESRLLKRWGAEYLLEVVDDPPTAYKQASYLQNTYFRTNQITSSPLTEGVTNIWYSPDFCFVPLTQPLKVDNTWTVVVSGSKTALTRPITWTPPDSDSAAPTVRKEEPGTYSSSPPLVAYKERGKGRIVLTAFDPANTVLGYKHPFYEDIPMTRGNGQIGNDLLKLLDNSLAFLVQPTKDSTVLGGYLSQPYPKDPPPQPIDWSKVSLGRSTSKLFTGVIGARTAYSSGTGTVAQWAAAAKEAGLDYLVFAETFTQLTPGKWASLKEDCRQASTKDFLALPSRTALQPANDPR